MAQILVRDVDDGLEIRLQRRAARNGRSIEAELHDILRAAAAEDEMAAAGLGTAIANLFDGIGLTSEEAFRELRGYRLPDPFA